MTTRAQNLSQAIKEVGWDWETMEPSHPHTIAVATLREVVIEVVLPYMGYAEWEIVNKIMEDINELADELEALK